MKIVLCDDDAVLVSVMRATVLADHEIIGETNRAYEAAELVETKHADLLILDLSLGVGSGKDAMDDLRSHGTPCEVIVFTAFAGERSSLLAAGASAVVEKPDFAALSEAVAAVARRVDAGASAAPPATSEDAEPVPERRRRAEHAPMPPLLGSSPSGFEPPAIFKEAINASQPGDTVMVVALDDLEQLTRSWGELVAIDHRLAVARALRFAMREDDRMTIDDDGTIVVLLVAGEPEAAERVFSRVANAWDAAGGEGTIRAGYSTRVESEAPGVALGRAHGALVDCRAHPIERLLHG